MVSKHVGCLNDELAEDDKTGEIEEYGWWITKDSLRLLVTRVSLGLYDTLVSLTKHMKSGQPLHFLP